MCGIIGYTGRREAASVVIGGLKKLEYRGYDSFGFAVSGSEMAVFKKNGKISDFNATEFRAGGSLGIGHTRWATHGVPDDKNAHPHTDCSGKIAIVHNGIIENYAELRKELTDEGHVFSSDTDSEIIAHLLEKYYEGDLLSAVSKAVGYLEGAYAILAICEGEKRIVAARKGSPLVLGIGDGEIFASSDVTPLIEYTRKVIFLEDGDIVSFDEKGYQIYNGGAGVCRESELIDWDIDAARKGGFDHFMLKEIYEQSDVFYNAFYAEPEEGLIDEIKKAGGITVVGCGTSYHAGMIFRYLMEKYDVIPVRVDIASEASYFKPKPGSLVVAVSQSGETADTLAALRQAKSSGCTTMAVTNVCGSSITRVADYCLFMRAGPEISVAATKSFIAQVAVFMRLVDELSDNALSGSFSVMHRVIEECLMTDVDDAVSMCMEAKSLFFIGRGPYYPVSLEGALKMKEITYIHAEGYPAGELKHGPFSLLDESTPVVAVCPEHGSRALMLSNIREIKSRGAPVIALGSAGDIDLREIVDIFIPLPKAPESGDIITSSVILQLLAYRTAVAMGRDVDKPRNLAKSVTVV